MGQTEQQVLVQLGPVPQYAWHYARLAQLANPQAVTRFITDQQIRSAPAGVQVEPAAAYASPSELAELAEALRAIDLDPTWRDGYWLRIFGRFLILRNLARTSPVGPVVHLECDVLSTLDAGMLERAVNRIQAPNAMAFIDEQTACPGIVISRSPEALEALAGRVISSLLSGRRDSDMQALAQCRDDGLLGVLPTLPTSASDGIEVTLWRPDGSWSESQRAEVVFDGAAVGQYLFGIDPRNNNGVRVPGYRETRGGIDPGMFTDWTIARDRDDRMHVAFRHDDVIGVLAVVHIHAKAVIPAPDPESETWRSALAVANGREGAQPVIDLPRYLRHRLRSMLRGR